MLAVVILTVVMPAVVIPAVVVLAAAGVQEVWGPPVCTRVRTEDTVGEVPPENGVRTEIENKVLSKGGEDVRLAAVRYNEPETETFPILAWITTSRGRVKTNIAILTPVISVKLDISYTELKAKPRAKEMINGSRIFITITRLYCQTTDRI